MSTARPARFQCRVCRIGRYSTRRPSRLAGAPRRSAQVVARSTVVCSPRLWQSAFIRCSQQATNAIMHRRHVSLIRLIAMTLRPGDATSASAALRRGNMRREVRKHPLPPNLPRPAHAPLNRPPASKEERESTVSQYASRSRSMLVQTSLS